MRKISQAYLLIFATFSIVYLFLFRTPLFANQHVLFYRGNLLLLVTVLTLLIIPGMIKGLLKVRYETFLAALVMSASLHLAFFVVFPVTFDRSVTTYLLTQLKSAKSNACMGLTETQMEQDFIKSYVRQNKAINRRINEQSIINLVTKNNQCVQLTFRGQQFLNFSEFVKKLYNLN